MNIQGKIDFKKIKINSFYLLKYTYSAAIVAIIVVLAFLLLFLYRNVYQTLTEAKQIASLKGQVAEEVLEKEKLQKIIERLKQKTEKTEIIINDMKNPFLAPAPAPPTE